MPDSKTKAGHGNAHMAQNGLRQATQFSLIPTTRSGPSQVVPKYRQAFCMVSLAFGFLRKNKAISDFDGRPSATQGLQRA